jgi:hypothetical protein
MRFDRDRARSHDWLSALSRRGVGLLAIRGMAFLAFGLALMTCPALGASNGDTPPLENCLRLSDGYYEAVAAHSYMILFTSVKQSDLIYAVLVRKSGEKLGPVARILIGNRRQDFTRRLGVLMVSGYGPIAKNGTLPPTSLSKALVLHARNVTFGCIDRA